MGLSVLLAGAFGVVLRVQLLTRQPLSGDEAVAGLMAKQILHGHLYTFYWGNQYGGGEIYVVALIFAVFGASAVALNAAASVVTALGAFLLWRAARRLGRPTLAWPALVAAEAFWIWPEAAVWNSTRQFGFREVTAAAGIGAILCTLRLLDRWSTADAAALGLLLGIGWWSSPEIIYFAIAVGTALGTAACRRDSRPSLRAFAVVTATFVVGAIPWLWTNLHTHLASLNPSSSPSYLPSTYADRLSLFFHKVLPMMLGLRVPLTGSWVGGRLGQVAYLAAAGLVVAACIWGVSLVRDPARAGHVGCCVATLLFPFAYSAFPATSYWIDGHYGVFVVPLMLLAVAGCLSWPRRPARHRQHAAARAVPVIGAVAVLAALSVTTASAFSHQFLGGRPGTFWQASTDPNRLAIQAVQLLERRGVGYAYADYWTAYDLDFLSHGRLSVTDPSADRWLGLYRRVKGSPDPAWLFYAPSQVAEASTAFSSPSAGPFGYPEATFLAHLAELHVACTVVHTGVLDAVFTATKVDQAEVGMGPPAFGS